ncbi:MAG: polysaccharide deacetylase family protein [Ferruginibacter sp.]
MNKQKDLGKFVISLDFELMWGVRDHATPATYGANICGVHEALPKLLEVFTAYKIHGTFSTVGFLFFDNKEELQDNLPTEKPAYIDKNLSPYEYNYLEKLGESYPNDPYHYGSHLLKLIQNTADQEIGTHTFSHYYCLESGQKYDAFKEDMKSAVKAAALRGVKLQSIIFPRNQINREYLKICEENGITSYRNNPVSWLYNARSTQNESLLRRACRLVDAYVNLSGHNCYSNEHMSTEFPVNIPGSSFLRPYSEKLKFLDGMRLARIKNSMTHAAKNNLMYHLWWHPHNFGTFQKENFAFLRKILDHYLILNKKYSFTSYTMTELANILTKK